MADGVRRGAASASTLRCARVTVPRTSRNCLSTVCAAAVLFLVACAAGADPLESWNDLESKQAIIRFVRDATTPDATTFIPASERIAVFDNDGTLWVEQPIYV